MAKGSPALALAQVADAHAWVASFSKAGATWQPHEANLVGDAVMGQ